MHAAISRFKFQVVKVAAISTLLAPCAAFATPTYLNLFTGGADITLDSSGNLYVAGNGSYTYQKFSPTGTLLFTSKAPYGSAAGDLEGPTGIALDSSNDVYVVDDYTDYVSEFDSSGNYIRRFGGLGSGNGNLSDPSAITLGPDGNYDVADTGNNRIEEFTPTGSFNLTLGSFGSGAGQMKDPTDVQVDANGDVYVADYGNSRIDTYHIGSHGAYLSTGSFSYGSVYPLYVSASAGSSPQIYETYNPTSGPNLPAVNVFNSSETYLYTFAQGGVNIGSPASVAVAPNGLIYVGDSANGKIDRYFDPAVWVSGYVSFIDSTTGPTSVGVGTGDMLGTSLNLDSARSLAAQALVIDSSGTMTQSGGTVAVNALNVSGSYTYQSGTLESPSITTSTPAATFTLAAGSLSTGTINVTGNFTMQSGTQLTATTVTINSNGTFTQEGLTTFNSLTNSGNLIDANTSNLVVLPANFANYGTFTTNASTYADVTSAITGTGSIVNNGATEFAATTTIGNLSGSGQITIGTSISSTAKLTIAPSTGTSTQFSIAIQSGSTLDLSNNKLVINFAPYSDPISVYRAELISGYNLGKWTGTGIISSNAANTPGTSVGYADTGSSITFMYTWIGDANLDGLVNSIDLADMSATGTTWATGDFNYDNKVNADDYSLFALGDVDSKGANISTLPEPSAAALLSLAASLMRRKCRKTGAKPESL